MTMIAIMDYDAGNLTSVARAVTHIGFECVVTNDIGEMATAERIIFPGVGAAGSAMASLRRLGLDRAIKDAFDAGSARAELHARQLYRHRMPAWGKSD